MLTLQNKEMSPNSYEALNIIVILMSVTDHVDN